VRWTESDYSFVSADRFQQLIDDGELLEWAEIHVACTDPARGGTRSRGRARRIPVLIEVDLAGAKS